MVILAPLAVTAAYAVLLALAFRRALSQGDPKAKPGERGLDEMWKGEGRKRILTLAGMYLSADQPTRSLRATAEGVLIVGGEGHKAGQDPDTSQRYAALEAWAGTELGTGYSELVDPVEERARLIAQSLLAARGDPEAMVVDEEFLQALEYGMPPTGGMGMGIDRMLIMFTGETIRETILFPMVRPD